MTTAILCFCCPGTGQQKRQSSIYSPVATYGSRKNAAGAYAAAAWVKKRLIFVGIIFIYFQVGLNSNGAEIHLFSIFPRDGKRMALCGIINCIIAIQVRSERRIILHRVMSGAQLWDTQYWLAGQPRTESASPDLRAGHELSQRVLACGPVMN